MTKTCSRCKETKDISLFTQVKHIKSGYGARCKACTNELSRNYRKQNPDKVTRWHKSYYDNNKERAAAASLEWQRNNKDKVRWIQLKSNHGITKEQWEEIYAKQNGACAICDLSTYDLHVDHDHACCSGRRSCGMCIRGLLCGSCNRAMGLIKDNKETAKKMIEYLTNFEYVGLI